MGQRKSRDQRQESADNSSAFLITLKPVSFQHNYFLIFYCNLCSPFVSLKTRLSTRTAVTERNKLIMLQTVYQSRHFESNERVSCRVWAALPAIKFSFLLRCRHRKNSGEDQQIQACLSLQDLLWPKLQACSLKHSLWCFWWDRQGDARQGCWCRVRFWKFSFARFRQAPDLEKEQSRASV